MKNKKAIILIIVLCIILIALIACIVISNNGETDNNIGKGNQTIEKNGTMANGNQTRGTIDKSDDEELQTLLEETESKFEQIDYTDEKTGKEFAYNIFVPDDYNDSTEYPLVLFITDGSIIGGNTTDALEQGYGAVVWASEEDQSKHPCFIIAPEYPESILDGEDDVTDYVTATLNLLEELQEEYSIDSNRLYITGQSMGCMTALYLNGTYPDLFAASLYVDGQWSTDILESLENQKFFYFAAEGDDKASEGMANVKAMFDEDGVSYAEATLNTKDSSDEINSAIEEVINQGYSANFISWEEGSVLPDGNDGSSMGSEHMYSFDHAYKISNVRDWLFEQAK